MVSRTSLTSVNDLTFGGVQYDVLKVKNALLKSAYCVTDGSITVLAVFLQHKKGVSSDVSQQCPCMDNM